MDAARGLAALSVTVYHFQIGAGLAHATHLPWLQWVNWPGARLAVPLFFVISGFSIHYAEHEKLRGWTRHPGAWRSYCARRLWRIYPPYVAALLLAVGLKAWTGESIAARDIAAHLLMVYPFSTAYFNSINVVFWSVGVEIWLYGLYPFALLLLETCGLRVAGAAVFLASAASIGITAAVSPTKNVVGDWFVLNLFFGWCMGAALAQGFLTGEFFFRSARWWLAGAVLFAAFLALSAGGVFEGVLWPAFIPSVVVLAAWVLSAVLLLEGRRTAAGGGRGALPGWLRWLGAISYSLYLVHTPLIDVRNTVLQRLPGHAWRAAGFCLWYALPFVVAWLYWLGVEKPSMRISKRLKAATVTG